MVPGGCLSPEALEVAEALMHDFEQSGILLGKEVKQKVQELRMEELQLQFKFVDNLVGGRR